MPEIMWGISRKWMLHAAANFSNESDKFKLNGGQAYLKYRFFSMDDVHDHLRMAAYAKFAFNNLPVFEQAISLGRLNSGYEGGVVATKLIDRVALSSSIGLVKAADNGNYKFNTDARAKNALNYTFSMGKLMLPKAYINYNQTNVNLMLEALGQTNFLSGKSYLDVAPSIQFILKSRMRVDLGYRFAVVNDLDRASKSSALIQLEYNFFNVY